MESQPATPQLAVARRSVRIVLFASLLLLAGGLMQTAFAAKDQFNDCDELALNLRSLDVPPAELPLDNGKHLDASDDSVLEAVADDTVSPVLLLTPRVANIMREVFDSVAIDTEVTAIAADDTSAAEPEADSPPVVNAKPAPVVPAADETVTNTHYMPRFQRQMYRTDI